MAKRRRRPHRPKVPGAAASRPAWSVLRPVAWSALLGAAFATALATPAYAAPPPAYLEPGQPGQVPDGGTRPVPAGPLTLPGGATAPQPVSPTHPTSPTGPTPATAGSQAGPFAQQLNAAEADVASRAEALKKLRLDRANLRAELTTDERAWRTADQAARAADRVAQEAAGEAYREAAALPPGAAGSDLHELSRLSRLRGPQAPSSTAAGREAVRAREAERAAHREYQEVLARLAAVERQYAIQEPAYRARVAAFQRLRQRNAAALAEVERQREAQDQRLGRQFLTKGSGTGTAPGGLRGTGSGLRADAKADQAVRFALAQLGEPYEWGAEGPGSWDCSGLMWGAYQSVGITIPRVAADQYHGTRHQRVDRRDLLPGDLLFFASNPSDWRSIHHVGMYIGGGRMVHAPTTGDVVKVATVWWSRYYAATRVVGAVRGATETARPNVPAPRPSTPPKPRPTTSPRPTVPPRTPRPTNPPTAPPGTTRPPSAPTSPPTPRPSTPSPLPSTPGPGTSTPDPGPSTPAPARPSPGPAPSATGSPDAASAPPPTASPSGEGPR